MSVSYCDDLLCEIVGSDTRLISWPTVVACYPSRGRRLQVLTFSEVACQVRIAARRVLLEFCSTLSAMVSVYQSFLEPWKFNWPHLIHHRGRQLPEPWRPACRWRSSRRPQHRLPGVVSSHPNPLHHPPSMAHTPTQYIKPPLDQSQISRAHGWSN